LPTFVFTVWLTPNIAMITYGKLAKDSKSKTRDLHHGDVEHSVIY
jgi:hypothetical protein